MMIDNVDGMIERAGDAHDRAARDQLAHARRLRRERGADEEQHQPELQRALAPEAIAERAGGEQEAGEHERVDRDDPLQLRLGGVQLAREGRDRDVQARVADEHDQQAQAEHRERPPTAIEREIGRALGRGFHGHSGDGRTAETCRVATPEVEYVFRILYYNRNHASA